MPYKMYTGIKKSVLNKYQKEKHIDKIVRSKNNPFRIV
jgi:hypothetical protein